MLLSGKTENKKQFPQILIYQHEELLRRSLECDGYDVIPAPYHWIARSSLSQ